MKFRKVVFSVMVISVIFMLASAMEVPRCGTVPAGIGNVYGGSPANSNYWKWLVAFRHIPTSKFFCAGSLVSAKHVISAAHCFRPKYSGENREKLPHEVIAWVGKHDLTIDNESGSVAHEVREILNHEDWSNKTDDYDADLSLIVLETEVDLQQSGFVRTVCLPTASNNEVTGIGMIVGWGISEKSIQKGERHDSIPNELQLPVVTESQCLEADDGFYFFLSNRSFCAGFVNEDKSACQGDNGGGFFQLDKITREYKLIGIVSASLTDQLKDCRVDTYSMFTSVGKFVGWIERKMEETFENRVIEVEMECQWYFCSHNYTGPFSRNIRLRQSFEDATSVNDLTMNFKPSPYIYEAIGKNFPNVKVLSIADQSIKFVGNSNFKNMEQLEILYLYNNQIEIIEEETFHDLPSLKELSLQKNKLKQLPVKIFNNLKNLVGIYIYSNKISTLPRDLFNDNLKLRYVHTYNNIGLTTNNVDFSKVPNVRLFNETWSEYY